MNTIIMVKCMVVVVIVAILAGVGGAALNISSWAGFVGGFFIGVAAFLIAYHFFKR